MNRALAAALLVTGLLGAPALALAGNPGRPNPGVIGIPGPGIVAPGTYGSPLVPVPNTAAARQWSPPRAPGVAPHVHQRAFARPGVFVPSTVVVVPQVVAPQPQWVDAGWWWDGWQWVWVPGYWAW
jgi:hypothetical protein